MTNVKAIVDLPLPRDVLDLQMYRAKKERLLLNAKERYYNVVSRKLYRHGNKVSADTVVDIIAHYGTHVDRSKIQQHLRCTNCRMKVVLRTLRSAEIVSVSKNMVTFVL